MRGLAPVNHFFGPNTVGCGESLIGQVSHEPYAERVNDLVCLDLALGTSMVDRIARAWDNGDAVFPLDQRLPAPERERVLNAVKPTVVFDGAHDTRVDGTPVEHGDAVVVSTSGTTGTPKAAILTHDAVKASAVATSTRLGVTPDDMWFACLPPAHVGGLSVVLRSLVLGTRLMTANSFSVDAYNDAASQGATLVSLVATALRQVDASRFRQIVLGGARPPADRPQNCIVTYGLTETGSGVVYDGIPLDGVEIDIRDSVVHVRAPMLLRAYRDGSHALDQHGWFRTGDMGEFTDGTLKVFGREGDLIITGGENVWPETVEDVLKSHPSVTDVCVAGLPDPHWGQSVTAWIVSAPKATVSLEELRDFVKAHLPAYCAPRGLRLVESIPRTALGKPRRAELVAQVND